jgi:hypothetical protein
LVSFVKGRRPPEIEISPARTMMGAMSTLDYWLYSIGLVLVTLIVAVA